MQSVSCARFESFHWMIFVLGGWLMGARVNINDFGSIEQKPSVSITQSWSGAWLSCFFFYFAYMLVESIAVIMEEGWYEN